MRVQGLNRTSVGLKRREIPKEPGPPPRPQSNQRGIETAPRSLLQGDQAGGLNRTSVGLKLIVRMSMSHLAMSASIEPAWD